MPSDNDRSNDIGAEALRQAAHTGQLETFIQLVQLELLARHDFDAFRSAVDIPLFTELMHIAQQPDWNLAIRTMAVDLIGEVALAGNFRNTHMEVELEKLIGQIGPAPTRPERLFKTALSSTYAVFARLGSGSG